MANPDFTRRLDEYLGDCLQRARAAVAQLDPDYLLSENEDLLLGGLLRDNLPRPVSLAWDAISQTGIEETQVQVRDQFYPDREYTRPASRIRIRVPIDGDPMLLTLRATTYIPSPLDADVAGSLLQIEVVERQLSAHLVQARIARVRERVEKQVEWANGDLATFARQASATLQRDYSERKQRILNDRALSEALAIPLSATGRQVAPVPARRKHVSLEQRRTQSRFVPEPELDEATYRDILDQVQSWARSLERTPGTLSALGEEQLRDLLLAHLNAYWQGAAGGELFNGAGKTDVLIREKDRNVFVAECKIWSGTKAAGDAVDQLLRYLVWRDSKGALIVFVRTRDPAATIDRLHAAVTAHPAHAMTKASHEASRQVDYLLTADDEGRRINLAVIPVIQRVMDH
ncbi:hypothetical protein [Microbacterium sp. bgisy207]|uniref:hypothetical protein n=1 Tax=Microbacterium sp. bgisy207 TaxID=3413800 RepID=UPI003EBF6689